MSEPWRAALRTFDADLQRRGSAERTRKAYGTDAAELAAWATANEPRPHPGRLQGPAPLGRAPVAEGRRPAHDGAQARVRPHPVPLPRRARPDHVQPGRPAARRRSSRRASRRCSSPRTSSGCWRRSRPPRRWRCATARCSSWRTRPDCRAEELVDLDHTLDRVRQRTGPRRGQGIQDTLRPCGRARPAHDRRLSRARPPGAALSGPGSGAFPVQERSQALDERCSAPSSGMGEACRHADRRPPTRFEALLRHPSAGRRGGSARHSDDAGTREYLDDPGLHSGRVRAAAGSLCQESPAGLGNKGLWRPT